MANMKKAKNKYNFAGIEKYVTLAAKLGKKAFLSGIKCVPALDKDLQNLFVEVRQNTENLPFGYVIPLMDSWAKAWTKENLDNFVNFK